MFGHTYYHGTIRRYVILFGTLFNDIYIRRFNNTGEMVKLIKIPITYGPKEKVISRINADANLNRPFSVILPYMSFELLSVTYDTSRKLNTVGQIVNLNTNKNLATYNYNPVPYNFNFQLNIMVKNAEDGSKIIEQILPYFTPDWTASVRIIDDPEIVVDIPTVLGDINVQDTYEGNFVDRRALIWTLKFTTKGYLFGPISKSKIIKVAKVNMGYGEGSDLTNFEQEAENFRVYETLQVQPGLTADGQPTNNVQNSIDYSLIDWSQDYGFAETIEYYPAGKDKE